jgi:aldehyde dehydrogenase (NAD+)
VLVDKAIEEKFLKMAKEEILNANYAIENDNYLQIINDTNVERLDKMLVKEKIYFGGEVNSKTRYIQPTIMNNVSFEDAVMQEEIFGPILPVISYTNIDEAISKVNELSKPLSCYVFTGNRAIKDKVLKQISFGGGAINEAVMHITNPKLPFGGVGKSGMGSYHGKAGFDCFTHYKSILDKPTWLELPIKYAPYSKRKLSWMKRLFKFQ